MLYSSEEQKEVFKERPLAVFRQAPNRKDTLVRDKLPWSQTEVVRGSYRYSDDVRFIWTHSEEQLSSFIEYNNSYHQTIKFTTEKSSDSVSYLDVSVSRKGRALETDLRYKEYFVREQIVRASKLDRERLFNQQGKCTCKKMDQFLLERHFMQHLMSLGG